jgi:hypothetical protein
MSLDVYLIIPGYGYKEETHIHIRENGRTKTISQEEWELRNPGCEPVICISNETDTVYQANITHNLGKYAEKADLYMPLWRPEEISITNARQLLVPLASGLTQLLDPDFPIKHRDLLPSNGWGTHKGLVEFVKEYLSACIKYTDAEVKVWR